ncbi:histidinol dehydrogenase [Desulfuribacillus stibiiarsenatis]|uniref:Histidinol dehydrogenase n=1 Tax=Desulfuribacillus stibiiarsenatis TaxID=1390249 RepID=A0A1E5L9I9_9FIRM|nr:histidinol dehydrogenase [Desulfuribacillus stibiiarsenatis]OEH86810.1 histidinol dehydrogenase [Desulfuribacillus stibiiarsenatis]
MVQVQIIESKDFSYNRNVETGNQEQMNAVLHIINEVKTHGDQAVKAFTKQFDRVDIEELLVSEEEIQAAYAKVSQEYIQTIREARDNIRRYHEKQKQSSWFTTEENGTVLGQKVTPLDRVGVYVPGGTAAYPSSVLMNVIPAQIAGVREIVMCTPPGKDGIPPIILVAAKECGVTHIYRIGGAQAVAALAYGTESIPKVDKITGPGNIYVAIAKKMVFGMVDIDMIAGPSEILVACDESADASYAAADMLSQAEHDVLAAAYCVTLSRQKAEEIHRELEIQLAQLNRNEIAKQSIENQARIIIAPNRAEMVRVINEIAPEHLEMMVEEPFSYLGEIRHAGAIFLGRYSSEPVGDYFAGPNHVLPTSGTARFSSPLSVDDFIKKSSVIYYSKQAMIEHGRKIAGFANEEGLDAHAKAVAIRIEKEGL